MYPRHAWDDPIGDAVVAAGWTVDALVEDDGFVGQWTPLLRIHHAPSTTTPTINAADTNIAS